MGKGLPGGRRQAGSIDYRPNIRGFESDQNHTARLHIGALSARVAQSFAPTLHSCFLERSQQQEATPSFAYCSLCMLLRRCACWRRPLGFPYRT